MGMHFVRISSRTTSSDAVRPIIYIQPTRPEEHLLRWCQVWLLGRGASPLPPARGLEERRELPARVRSGAPTAQRLSTIFSSQHGLSWHYNIVICGLSCSRWGGAKTPVAPLRTPLMPDAYFILRKGRAFFNAKIFQHFAQTTAIYTAVRPCSIPWQCRIYKCGEGGGGSGSWFFSPSLLLFSHAFMRVSLQNTLYKFDAF